MRRRFWLAAFAAAGLTVACGSASTSDAPWRSGHPDPPGVIFDAMAPGLCALPVRYPDVAPAAIEFQGAQFIQRERDAPSAPPAGRTIGRSADWTLTLSNGEIYLVSTSAMFRYQQSVSC